ncbi:DUF2934 domain-containing protein [Rhizobium leguminosarum]|uniref:DUF2934 domain-containing protein n=1 Tax=Rhizobium leguminosarum TaxID=384 RepID=UPI000380629C|nr:DUF2934 domain-containing protein [Rhizobium leguminosarum]
MGQEGREDLIRDRAQQIWEREGKKDGDHERHWRQAEQEIREEQVGEEGASDTGSQTGRKAGGAKGIASGVQPGRMSPGGGPAAGADSMGVKNKGGKGISGPN